MKFTVRRFVFPRSLWLRQTQVELRHERDVILTTHSYKRTCCYFDPINHRAAAIQTTRDASLWHSRSSRERHFSAPTRANLLSRSDSARLSRAFVRFNAHVTQFLCARDLTLFSWLQIHPKGLMTLSSALNVARNKAPTLVRGINHARARKMSERIIIPDRSFVNMLAPRNDQHRYEVHRTRVAAIVD